jgi:DNA invertase Pin-like site-specific DNA recombinase
MKTLTVPRPLAWALCVVSSGGQEETIPNQRAWAIGVAKAKNWRLLPDGIFEGVASGKLGPRSIVRDILKKLRATEPDARPEWLCMIRADRLGRGDMVESQIVLRDLHQLGVKVWTRDQGELKLDSAIAKLFVAMQASVAEQENAVKQDKMRDFRKRKREEGLQVGKSPYAIRREKGVDSPDPKRAPVVKEAFALRLQGKGYGAIGQRLAAIAPPHEYKHKSKAHPERTNVVHWTAPRVSKLLTNHAYVDAGLIDSATFVQAQGVAKALTNDRTGDPRRVHCRPLAGVLTCYCGRKFVGAAYGSSGHKYPYYVCRALWNHDGKHRIVRAEPIESQFRDLLGRLDASPELVKRYRARAASPVSMPALERTIRDGNAQLANLAKSREKAFQLNESGHLRDEDLQARLDTLTEQRDKLQAEVNEAREQVAAAKALAQRQQDAEELLRRAVKIFEKANVAQQNEIAKAVRIELGVLTVDKDKVLLVG